MNTTDPIADMLTRIRNANQAKFKTVDIPASNMKKNIAEILFNEGYIKAYDYCKNELYHKYCDNDKRGHCSILVYIDNFEIVKIIESGHDGYIRIWNFHTGFLLNKIAINNSAFSLILFRLVLGLI